MEELVDESFLLLVAGSDTTAYSIACATYYLLTHSDCQRKLKEELKEVPKDENGEIDWKNIAELPYLVCSNPPPIFLIKILTGYVSNRPL